MYENSVLYRNKEGAVYLYLDIVHEPRREKSEKEKLHKRDIFVDNKEKYVHFDIWYTAVMFYSIREK